MDSTLTVALPAFVTCSRSLRQVAVKSGLVASAGKGRVGVRLMALEKLLGAADVVAGQVEHDAQRGVGVGELGGVEQERGAGVVAGDGRAPGGGGGAVLALLLGGLGDIDGLAGGLERLAGGLVGLDGDLEGGDGAGVLELAGEEHRALAAGADRDVSGERGEGGDGDLGPVGEGGGRQEQGAEEGGEQATHRNGLQEGHHL
ncbi:MAG: hypothetical protein QM765_37615 [Myxococcales bacterium]